MSITEWEIDTDSPSSITYTTDIATPIFGNGSLLFQYSDTVAGSINALPSVVSGFPHAVTAGKFRTLFRVKAFNGSSPLNVSSLGIIAMQAERNSTGTTSSRTFYAVAVLLPEGLGTGSVLLKLYKALSIGGLKNIYASTELASMTYPTTVSVGSLHSIELQWISSLPQLGGTFLIVRTGTQVDYSDLTSQLSYTDTSSPLLTTVGEGLFAYFKGGSSVLKQFIFDETKLYQLT